MTLDIKVIGDNARASIGMEGTSFDILKIGSEAYIKADEAFWKKNAGAAPAVLALLKDKWIKAGKDDAFSDFTTFTDVEQLIKPDGPVTKGETTTINGTAAISLKDASGEGALYIATTGEPYPLRLEGPAGEGKLDFSEFGATFDEIKAPPAAEIVDLDQLGK